uniref:Uncharacterized protein n=1 Tax=Plectus sambesii TaxID=2011161 RepID=A0A914W0P5_9BILA
MMKLGLLVVATLALIVAVKSHDHEHGPDDSHEHGTGGGHGTTPCPRCALLGKNTGLPGSFIEQLPEEIKTQLTAIQANKTLSWPERREMIDQIVNNLPDEIRAKMPLPDGFEKLPQDVRDQLKHVYMNKSLNWDEKREQITAIIDNLPEEVSKLLPPPGLPAGFELLPSEVQAQIKAVIENKSIKFGEKCKEIRKIMDGLPEEIKSRLPPAEEIAL